MGYKLVVFETAELIPGLIFLSRSMVIDIKRPVLQFCNLAYSYPIGLINSSQNVSLPF